MKRVAILALVLLAVAPSASATQRRKSSSASRPPANAQATAARRAGAERLVGEITTLSSFLFVYGSIVKGIQTSEAVAQRKPLTPTAQALLDKNKAGVVESLHNLQDGMRRTEMDFSEDANLSGYYQHINKLSEDVGLAADSAAAGKYDDAGKRLVSVIEALARALLPETK